MMLRRLGWHSNPSLVERVTLSLRQHGAAMGRRTRTRCQGEAGLRHQLALSHVYDHCMLPHASLRLPLAEPMATHGTGSAKVWGPGTPAMAAGLTDHVWSLKAGLLYRVPPGPQPQTGEAAASMDERELQQLRSAHIPAKRAEWGGDNAWGVRLTS